MKTFVYLYTCLLQLFFMAISVSVAPMFLLFWLDHPEVHNWVTLLFIVSAAAGITIVMLHICLLLNDERRSIERKHGRR